MEAVSTINIPVTIRGDFSITPRIESLLSQYATRLLQQESAGADAKPLSSFRGIMGKGIDFEALRRRAMREKFKL